MSDLTVRVLISFLITGLVFSVTALVLLLIATAPVLSLGIPFGLLWTSLFIAIHVRPRSTTIGDVPPDRDPQR